MEIVNDTPYAFLPFDCSPAPSMSALSLIVKGELVIRHGEPAKVPEGAHPPSFQGDDIYMDDLGRSLRYATDLVALKTRGEATVTATCHVHGGRPRETADVAIAIGPIQKTLRVTGERMWAPGGGDTFAMTKTQPFLEMPIRWERAFGGLDHLANPLGRGIDREPSPDGKEAIHLPSVEYTDGRVTHIHDRPKPAGFGPISPMWNPRLARQGTRDQRWAAFRAPLPPLDADARAANAAPDDQQLDEGAFFRGDERIVLSGLRPDVEVYETALPGKRLRLFLLYREGTPQAAAAPAPPGDAPSRFVEVVLKLDTVHIDAEKEMVTLIWRQPIAVAQLGHPEIEAIYLAEEGMRTEPASRLAHFERLVELRGPLPEPMNAAIEREAEKQMAEAQRILAEANVDPALRKQVKETKDPQKVFDLLTRFIADKTKEIERMGAGAKRR